MRRQAIENAEELRRELQLRNFITLQGNTASLLSGFLNVSLQKYFRRMDRIIIDISDL